MLNWEKLLETSRYSSDGQERPPQSDRPLRTFTEDAERIIYSSAFRRMQGKTQVHPLPISDYVRTRLTHTNEVAHTGRMIANACQDWLIDHGHQVSQLGDIVYAACLAHDIGNPPFGHIGEYAIQTWFIRRSGESGWGHVKDLLSGKYASDFIYFDGNAQGFRILTRLAGWREKGGLQLSYATLGAFSKYPFGAGSHPEGKPKFGFAQADQIAASTVFRAMGLKEAGPSVWRRHPLAFLVEAADDICYLTTDIEDAARADVLDRSTAISLLKNIGDRRSRLLRLPQLGGSGEEDKLAYLRAGAISTMIDEVVTQFTNRYDRIMSSAYNGNLLLDSDLKDDIKKIRDACENVVYNDPSKLQIEAAGFTIILALMDLYGGMIHQYVDSGAAKLDRRNSGLFQLLPIDVKNRLTVDDPYTSFLALTDYISGMTDKFALDLYRKLTGSSRIAGVV